jgi:hypothetical protein
MDISNMLLVAHCATNWMLFYRWPRHMPEPVRPNADELQPMATLPRPLASAVTLNLHSDAHDNYVVRVASAEI